MGKSKDLATGETRFVNTAGDTMTGNLGINETSPSGSLHVKGTSSTHGKIILEAGGSGGSANNNFMEFNKHDGTKLGEIEIGESVSNGGSLVFKTTPSGGSATTRMTINHDGAVTMPSQPYIELRGTSNSEVNSHGSVTTYKSWYSQAASGGITWNNSNGRITVPVAGKYLFAAKFFQWMNNTSYHYIHVRKNGTVMEEYGTDFTHTGGGGRTDHTITTNDIFTLAANDYVDFNVNADIYGGPIYTNCQVRLLG